MSDTSAWFKEQQEKGLVDIHVSVRKDEGVTGEAVLAEVIRLDNEVKAGNTLPLPEPTEFLPEEVEKVFNSVSI